MGRNCWKPGRAVGGNGFCRRKWAGIGEQKEEEEIRLPESHNCLSRFLGLLFLFLGQMGEGYS